MAARQLRPVSCAGGCDITEASGSCLSADRSNQASDLSSGIDVAGSQRPSERQNSSALTNPCEYNLRISEGATDHRLDALGSANAERSIAFEFRDECGDAHRAPRLDLGEVRRLFGRVQRACCGAPCDEQIDVSGVGRHISHHSQNRRRPPRRLVSVVEPVPLVLWPNDHLARGNIAADRVGDYSLFQGCLVFAGYSRRDLPRAVRQVCRLGYLALRGGITRSSVESGDSCLEVLLVE